MNFWQEMISLLFFIIAGILLGNILAKFRGKYWATGCFISISLLCLLAFDKFFHFLSFVQPFTFFFAGRFRFIFVAFALIIGLTPIVSRLKSSFQKIILTSIIMASVTWFSVLPLVMPVMMKNTLLKLPTILDSDGICFQSTNYTCAPAAAVTALSKLGFSANEGELAFLSYTNPITGTFPVCLENAIQSRYANKGLDCRYRRFNSIDELKNSDMTIAVIKSSLLWDHCIVVLEVSDNYVDFGDPGIGRVRVTRPQFEKMWRFTGIAIKTNASVHT